MRHTWQKTGGSTPSGAAPSGPGKQWKQYAAPALCWLGVCMFNKGGGQTSQWFSTTLQHAHSFLHDRPL